MLVARRLLNYVDAQEQNLSSCKHSNFAMTQRACGVQRKKPRRNCLYVRTQSALVCVCKQQMSATRYEKLYLLLQKVVIISRVNFSRLEG